MMKIIRIIIILLTFGEFGNNLIGQTTNLFWAKQMGGAAVDGPGYMDSGKSIAIDANGNIYTTGTFIGTADFDPGPSTFNLTSAGFSDVFVCKFDHSGNFVWARHFSGTAMDYSNSIAVDLAGDIYTTGSFSSDMDFDPGPGIYNLTSVSGSLDIFISKLDGAGNFLWAKQIGGLDPQISHSIAIDHGGNVYSTGYFSGTVDFDPGPGTYELIPAGSVDMFISKLDVSGNFLWAKQFGGIGIVVGHSIKTDGSGNVLTTGRFEGSVDFNPGVGHFDMTAVGQQDVFISKLDAAGNFQWAKQIGGTAGETGHDLHVDAGGNILIAGDFGGTVDFDPGPTNFSMTSSGNQDGFISKLDEFGNLIWARQFQGSSSNWCIGKSITTDISGNIHITGFFEGTVDFDPGIGIFQLSSAGNRDIFICKLSTHGNFIFAGNMGGPGWDEGSALAVNNSGNVYLTGMFRATADLDPGVETNNFSSAGGSDIFVVSLEESASVVSPAVSFNWAIRKGGAGNDFGHSIALDASGNIYSIGIFEGTVDFDPGPGTFTLTSNGFADVYISKLDVSGNLVWAKQLGGSSFDNGYSISIDASGNILTTGYFQSTVDFDPGVGVHTLSTVTRDVFVLKLDPSGNFAWAKQFSGANSSSGYCITVDLNGNIYTTGQFMGTADFDPGAGSYNLTAINQDAFITKLDYLGNFIWAKQLGGGNGASGNSIAVTNGSVYTTGSFTGTADFDPGPATFHLNSTGNADVFVSKLDAAGNFIWAKRMGGPGADFSYSLDVDNYENIYTTGDFNGIADFDPGTGIYNLNASSGEYMFVSKLNSSGNFVWARQMTGNSQGNNIVASGVNIYLTGHFSSTTDFDPGAGTSNLTATGVFDIFILKLDQSGNFLWVKQMSGMGGIHSEGKSIAVDNNGCVYTIGHFESTIDFNPGPEIYNLTSAGGYDVFVVKLSDPITIKFPQIFLDKALIQFGQTNIVWGRNFTPFSQVKVTISSQSQETIIADTTIVSNNQGNFSFTYQFIASLPQGVYSILAKDLNTVHLSYSARLVVVNNSPPITRDLKITAPITNYGSNLGASITLIWKDKPTKLSNLIPNSSLINVSYTLEYNKDNTGWQILSIKNGQGVYQQSKGFQHSFTPIQTGTYQFRVTDVYDLQNQDTSAHITVNAVESGASIVYQWDHSGPRSTIGEPIGIAADGTARIYLKISKKTGNSRTISNVNISISDPDNPLISEARLLGKLLIASDTTIYSIQGNSANSTSAISNIPGSGNIFWFWFVAPDDFVRNSNDNLISERSLQLTAAINYSDNSNESISRTITVVRPPLMLVHGWGGAESSWDKFFFLKNDVPEFYDKSSIWKNNNQRAIAMNPIGSFSENAKLLLNLLPNGEYKNIVKENYYVQSFQSFLKNMRDQGYASNRVDYISHSMGGSVGRTVMNLYPSQFKPAVGAPTLFKNYDSGFINKFITLNTPHNGSPLPDFIIQNATSNKLYYLLQNAYIFGDRLWHRRIFLDMFVPLEGTPYLNLSLPTEAFKNLQHGSEGVKFTQTHVKNHLLAGDIINDVGVCTATLNTLTDILEPGFFFKILKKYNLETCQQIDNFFNQYGINNFITDGDVVVHLNSQLPGKNISSSGNDYTIFYGISSHHTAVRNSNINYPISVKTLQLLNSPIAGSLFSNTVAANPTSGPTTYRSMQPTPSNLDNYIDTSKIVVDNPVRMSTVKIDSVTSIGIRLKDTINLKYTTLSFQGEVVNSTTKATSQVFVVQASPLYPDTQTIYATAVYDSLGFEIYYTDTLSLNVLKDPIILGLLVEPETKVLNANQKYIPGYFLIHNNYISNISIADTALHINIADPAVLLYSSTGKYFQAKDTGSTYVVISYKQFHDTLYFIINEPIEQNVIKACPNSTISFYAGIDDPGKSYKWQVDIGTGFTDIIPGPFYTGVNSATLLLNSPPTDWYNYKFRCIVSDVNGQFTSEEYTLKFVLTWTGAVDNAWENPLNWNCNTIPDTNTDVFIKTSSPRYPEINTSAACRRLDLQDGTSVNVKPGQMLNISGKDF